MRRRESGRSRFLPAGLPAEPGSSEGPGILYLIATPIGNLEDVTLRALRILASVDWIAAEDTRRTRILLQAHGITRRLISYHAHNEHRRAAELVERLRAGESGGLVTDAGTPGISDPGYLLAREARKNGVRVESIPGPSAVLQALLLSGLPCERFCFLGYPPPRGAARRRFVARALAGDRTLVLFESPHRIGDLVAQIAGIDPQREVALCREMTKRFEEVVRGSSASLLAAMAKGPHRGEYTVVIAPGKGQEDAEPLVEG